MSAAGGSVAEPGHVVGRVGERVVSLLAPHRDSNPTPITTSVVLTVPMSHEDVEAVFWRLLRGEGITFADLADEEFTRLLLLGFPARRGHGIG